MKRQLLQVGAITLLVFNVTCCSKQMHRIHIIPNNYEGWLVICEERKNGIDPAIGGHSYKYVFSKEGICNIRGEYAPGWGNDVFLYESGVAIESLPGAGGEIGIHGRYGGTIAHGGLSLMYNMFFVGSRDEYEHSKLDGRKKIDQLLREMAQ